MRRMISERSQQFIKNLSKSISSDGEGNVEVGKNLEVDGQLTINSASDLKTKDGTTFKGDAVGIEAVSLTDSKGLDFTMTDGTHLYTDSVQGPKGDTPKLYMHSIIISGTEVVAEAIFNVVTSDSTPITSVSLLLTHLQGMRVACSGTKWKEVTNDGTTSAVKLLVYYLFITDTIEDTSVYFCDISSDDPLVLISNTFLEFFGSEKEYIVVEDKVVEI